MAAADPVGIIVRAVVILVVVVLVVEVEVHEEYCHYGHDNESETKS